MTHEQVWPIDIQNHVLVELDRAWQTRDQRTGRRLDILDAGVEGEELVVHAAVYDLAARTRHEFSERVWVFTLRWARTNALRHALEEMTGKLFAMLPPVRDVPDFPGWEVSR